MLFTVLEVGVLSQDIHRFHLFLMSVAYTMCPHLAGKAAFMVLGIQLMPSVCQILLSQ